MKVLFMTSLFIGILMIVIGYINQIKKCPPPKVEYRYIPRTFEEEQNNPVKVSELFAPMFQDATTWAGGIKLGDKSNRKINKYFISQS
jgi:hypothetical protein